MIFLFAIVTFLFVQNQNSTKAIKNNIEKREEYKILVEDQEDQIKTLITSIEYSYNSNGKRILPDLMVQNENADSISFRSLIGNKTILVFRYSEIHCQVCVDTEISLLKEMSDIIGIDNIIVLSYYDSFRNMAAFKRINELSLPVLNLLDLGLDIEDINVPYYFVIDSSLIIKDVMIPNKYYPEVTKSYLNYVKDKF